MSRFYDEDGIDGPWLAAMEGPALTKARKALADAQAKSDRAVEARAALPAGSSRARVTTANARWMRAAEARDRAQELVDRLEKGGAA